MLKMPETPKIDPELIQSTETSDKLDRALRAQGWNDVLSQKVIDNPKLAELLVDVVRNSEELKRLKEI